MKAESDYRQCLMSSFAGAEGTNNSFKRKSRIFRSEYWKSSGTIFMIPNGSIISIKYDF